MDAIKLRSRMTTQLALTPSIKLGWCIGLLPLVRKKNNLRFKRRSLKFAYSIFCTTLSLINFGFFLAKLLLPGGWSFDNVVEAVWNGVSVINYCLFVNLASLWPKIIDKWKRVDAAMEVSYGFPKYLCRKLNIATIALMTTAVVEHTLSVAYKVKSVSLKNSGLKSYWTDVYRHIFNFVPYNPVLGVLVNVYMIISTLSWNYTDLFLILISTALSERFVQVQEKISIFVEKQVQQVAFWRLVRKDYNALHDLTKALDSALGNLIIVSYFINVFIVISQPMHSFASDNEDTLLISLVYFLFSFGYLLIRIILVTVSVAGIQIESNALMYLLNQLPTKFYNDEIERLSMQIRMDTCYFSGRELFRIKKSLIFTIAAAVTGYALIMVKFKTTQDNK